ncbi:Hypothetical predicted protein [Cloeon dipterum]|uniref:Laminin IV type A domain-containing protein n=1 Tax=Cloeon dipterum TaxID=197152 RepID=A0A8S1DQG7_9INSE|nr:Hypothetical predicted protein [Cloeon dipterum]
MEFFQYILFVAVIISPICATEKNETNPFTGNLVNDTDKIDPYNSTRWTFTQSEALVQFLWDDMDGNAETKYVPDYSPAVIGLPFDFNLFGQNIRKVEVMREGGIRSADPEPWWVAVPLKVGEFGLTPCQIKFLFKGASLSIQWQYRPQESCNTGNSDDELSYQLKIHANGSIDFVYKQIPFGNLKDFQVQFPDVGSKFGVSYQYKVPASFDTFTLGLQLNVNETDIKDNTVVSVRPQPQCTTFRSLTSCMVGAKNANISCAWCSKAEICSSKRDFLREVWMENGCNCPDPRSSKPENYAWTSGTSITFIIIAITLTVLMIVSLIAHYYINKGYLFELPPN